MNFIPVQYRLIATLAVVLALCAGVATGGYKMGQAQQMAVCAAKKERMQKKLDDLAEAVVLLEQDRSSLKQALSGANHAVNLLKAQSDAADQARIEAERQVEELKKSSDSRIKKLSDAKETATGCADLLGKYWEMRN